MGSFPKPAHGPSHAVQKELVGNVSISLMPICESYQLVGLWYSDSGE
jgi:hypothetical protein